ncbi:Amidase [Corchorus olitorius]|uniref:Amidase n=1 Tax=Corchorus olitorius TaxID=93759 RepID=A0A1R3J1C9_9ROSI|nr:Amidase [Corchorus olitorius]
MAVKPPFILFSTPILLLLSVTIRIQGHDFAIEEATIESIQGAFAVNKLTSLQLVDFYLQRIENLNPFLRGVLEINPDARVQAEEADRERSNGMEAGTTGYNVETTSMLAIEHTIYFFSILQLQLQNKIDS